MKVLDIIKQDQPIFYKELVNAFQSKRVPHAFLFIGDQASQISVYTAQAIIAGSAFFDEDSIEAKKIKEHHYADLIYFNGKNESIKKNVALNIQEQFSKSSIEGKSKIYLLEHIENSTPETLNKLLKILEEPEGDIFAIFTTSNINKVLPTIISRCMVINLLPASKESLRKQLNDSNCPADNIGILSELFSTFDECESFINNPDFDTLKLEVNYFIEDLYLHRDRLIIDVQTHLMKDPYKRKETISKKDLSLFLNMLVIGLKDLFHVKHYLPIVYSSFKSTYDRINIDDDILLKQIELVLNANYNLANNANQALLMDSLMYEL